MIKRWSKLRLEKEYEYRPCRSKLLETIRCHEIAPISNGLPLIPRHSARNSLPVGESSTIRGWPPPGRRARGAEGLGVAVARPLRNRWIPAWRQNNQMCQQCRESTGFLIELHGRGQIYKVLPAASPFFCQLSRAAAVCRGRARAPLFNLASRESLETPFFDSK